MRLGLAGLAVTIRPQAVPAQVLHGRSVAQGAGADSTFTIFEITGDRMRLQDTLCAATSANIDGCIRAAEAQPALRR